MFIVYGSEILQNAGLSNHIGRIHGNGKHAIVSGVRMSHLGNVVTILAQEPEVRCRINCI